jgi:NitT/TauT family transport system ATP-binding protein
VRMSGGLLSAGEPRQATRMTLTQPAAGDSLIRIDSVTQVFPAYSGHAPVTAIEDVTLDIQAGHFTAVVGPSGCGKSTLLNLISGLLRPTRGTVSVKGQQVTKVRDDIGYMPARDALLPWRTVQRNVEYPLESGSGLSAKERGARAKELIASVGLRGFEGHYPHTLSQGMRQRVAIARTFATSPDILLLDEPFSALDAQTRVHVQDLFLSLWEHAHRTVVLITHDVMEAVALADHVVVFGPSPGRVKAIYEIDLPRPRSVERLLFEEPVFQRYLRMIWSDLRSGEEAQ